MVEVRRKKDKEPSNNLDATWSRNYRSKFEVLADIWNETMRLNGFSGLL